MSLFDIEKDLELLDNIREKKGINKDQYFAFKESFEDENLSKEDYTILKGILNIFNDVCKLIKNKS